MRTLRAALASTTPPRSIALYRLTVLPVRPPETGVRHRPKPLYGANRFGCTPLPVLRVRLSPKQPSVFGRIAHLSWGGVRSNSRTRSYPSLSTGGTFAARLGGRPAMRKTQVGHAAAHAD